MRVVVDGVSKRYGRNLALDSISFEVHHGLIGLLGQNGAGKSTLLKILATVMPPTQGTIHYDGRTWPGSGQAIRQRLGYLPQIFGLDDEATGREFLRYAAAMKGIGPSHEIRLVADELLAEVGLSEAANMRLGHYSGGMRQRIALAQSLIGMPELLILDEPTAGLDPEERTQLKALLSLRARTATVLVSTHIVSDLDSLANTILVMAGGQVLAVGTPAEIAAAAAGLVYEAILTESIWTRVSARWTTRGFRADGVAATIRAEGDAIYLRVVADRAPAIPGASVHATAPTLEDGYLALTAGIKNR